MELNQILERLQSTIDNLNTLKESEFQYSRFIRKFNHSLNCPTVGCVAGYYPMWYPKSEFKYLTRFGNEVELAVLGETDKIPIREALMNFHKLSDKIIGILFFGELFFYKRIDGSPIRILSHNAASLDEVIERFEIIITGLSDGSICPDLPHKSEV